MTRTPALCCPAPGQAPVTLIPATACQCKHCSQRAERRQTPSAWINRVAAAQSIQPTHRACSQRAERRHLPLLLLLLRLPQRHGCAQLLPACLPGSAALRCLLDGQRLVLGTRGRGGAGGVGSGGGRARLRSSLPASVLLTHLPSHTATDPRVCALNLPLQTRSRPGGGLHGGPLPGHRHDLAPAGGWAEWGAGVRRAEGTDMSSHLQVGAALGGSSGGKGAGGGGWREAPAPSPCRLPLSRALPCPAESAPLPPLSRPPQYLTVRNERGREMLDAGACLACRPQPRHEAGARRSPAVAPGPLLPSPLLLGCTPCPPQCGPAWRWRQPCPRATAAPL